MVQLFLHIVFYYALFQIRSFYRLLVVMLGTYPMTLLPVQSVFYRAWAYFFRTGLKSFANLIRNTGPVGFEPTACWFHSRVKSFGNNSAALTRLSYGPVGLLLLHLLKYLSMWYGLLGFIISINRLISA